MAVLTVLLTAPVARAGYERSFGPGSLVIPMDLTYQDTGMLQAYGLVFQLLRQGVPVYWVIDPDKTWHAAPCDTAGDECAWDCAIEGSGVRCPYPTASPDFFASATVYWADDGTARGEAIAMHGYRGGPFVIDAADADAARPIIDAWNDPSTWDAAPWARRTVMEVVTVHETTAAFDGYVRKEMIAAPTIAVFSDGNEDIATGYLRAAGIPQSNGTEFPDRRCGGDCGPGTANPDMLTVESIMGDMGTCDAPNLDHRNGALFTEDGVPAYCQIMSMHWAVNDRETVRCDGGACPATMAECAGETFTYHGHEVVAEVRQFLQFPTHFFAECQAVNAYENTVPNPAWPYLDDEDRRGHFLTTEGTPPACPCTDGDFQCVTGGCGGVDCCLPRDAKERGAGFLIAAQPNAASLQVLSPEVPYNQMDGAFQTVGGSEPAYNLSDYLGTAYIGDADVTFITGPMGPGDQDVWMTGYVDGVCDIVGYDEFMRPGECTLGKVSYLGGHRYQTDTPLSRNADTQGTRMFLNALFEADCVTTAGQPQLTLGLDGPIAIESPTLRGEGSFTASWANAGFGAALDAEVVIAAPEGVEIVSYDAGGTEASPEVTWALGSIGPSGSTAPPAGGARAITLRFAGEGTYTLTATLRYRVGASVFALTTEHDVLVTLGRMDGGPATDAGTAGDAGAIGGADGGTGGGGDGCGCRASGRDESRSALALLGLLALVRWRRRR
ncbi:MAG: MYXO-CTERM sorting domain-containing protein [Sandaracinaceae bacterium]